MIFSPIDMYAEIILIDHLNFVDDLELPRPIADDSGYMKTTSIVLEVSEAECSLPNQLYIHLVNC